MSLRVVPLDLQQANRLITMWHRHHPPAVGHRFSLGAIDDSGVAHGAVIVGRPVSQHSGPAHEVAEVTRLVTDGTRNACSILYAAAARAARHMGFTRIQTFILAAEPGTSLKASGWVSEGPAGGNPWGHRPGRQSQSLGVKERWVLHLNPPPPALVLPVDPDAPIQETLTLGVMS